MPKERRPGWTYCFSEILNQEFAIHESGWVYFDTPHGIVKYSPEELDILEKGGETLTPELHNVKSVIGGTLSEITSETKPIEKKAVVMEGKLDIF